MVLDITLVYEFTSQYSMQLSPLSITIALPKTNIFEPENGWLEDDPASFWEGLF